MERINQVVWCPMFRRNIFNQRRQFCTLLNFLKPCLVSLLFAGTCDWKEGWGPYIRPIHMKTQWKKGLGFPIEGPPWACRGRWQILRTKVGSARGSLYKRHRSQEVGIGEKGEKKEWVWGTRRVEHFLRDSEGWDSLKSSPWLSPRNVSANQRLRYLGSHLANSSEFGSVSLP